MAVNAKMEVSLDEDDLKEILIDFLKAKGMIFSKEDIKFDSTSKIAWEWNRDVIVKVSASRDIDSAAMKFKKPQLAELE